MLEVPDWGSASWSWFGYSHSSFLQPWSEFWLSILIFKVQRTSMSFKSSFGTLEDAGGSWLGFDILILIWLWSGTLLGSSIKFWSHSDWLGSGSDATSDGRKLSWTQIYTFRFTLPCLDLPCHSIILNQSSRFGLSFDNISGSWGTVLFRLAQFMFCIILLFYHSRLCSIFQLVCFTTYLLTFNKPVEI